MKKLKTAVIGSRSLTVDNLEEYLPCGTCEIVSGGAKGIDTCAHDYAVRHGLMLTEFLPEYHKYGRRAPLIRNDRIIEHADFVVIFWDGVSRGTRYVIDACIRKHIPHKIYIPE